jgi:hypothetical protein
LWKVGGRYTYCVLAWVCRHARGTARTGLGGVFDRHSGDEKAANLIQITAAIVDSRGRGFQMSDSSRIYIISYYFVDDGTVSTIHAAKTIGVQAKYRS